MLAKDRFLVAVFSVVTLANCAPSTRGPVVGVSHAVASEAVYVVDADGRVHALRPDGREKWIYPLAEQLARAFGRSSRDFQVQSLLAENGWVYGLATQLTGGHAGEVYLFALDGERLVWQRIVPTPIRQGRALTVGEQALFMAGDDGTLYAFARTDGRLLWQHRTSGGPLSTPLVGADGTIYVVGAGNNLHAIAPDGQEKWRVPIR